MEKAGAAVCARRTLGDEPLKLGLGHKVVVDAIALVLADGTCRVRHGVGIDIAAVVGGGGKREKGKRKKKEGKRNGQR